MTELERLMERHARWGLDAIPIAVVTPKDTKERQDKQDAEKPRQTA